MHFDRDPLIIADGYAKEVLGVRRPNYFVGSPPLAFTFGLGGLATSRCASVPPRRCSTGSPPNMLKIIETYKQRSASPRRPRICAMLKAADEGEDISSPRIAVSAGGNVAGTGLREVDRENWQADPGRYRLDRAAAHLHHQSPERHAARGDGPAVGGDEAKVVDADMKEVPRGTIGKLAVRGPTGCRYLAESGRKTM